MFVENIKLQTKITIARQKKEELILSMKQRKYQFHQIHECIKNKPGKLTEIFGKLVFKLIHDIERLRLPFLALVPLNIL